MFRTSLSALLILLTLTLAACSVNQSSAPVAKPAEAAASAGGATAPESAPAQGANQAPAATAAATETKPELSPTDSSGTATSSVPAGQGQSRWTLASETSEARYRVHEQLANRPLPNDAVGVTKAISGQIVLDGNGRLVANQSKLTIDLRELKSDSDRRDNFIRRNTLETEKFPQAEFVPRQVKGLPSPLPTSGEHSFELVGDLTLHGVTKPVTWQAKAQVNDRELIGSAHTAVKFGDFGMTQPRVAVVLSVEDNIRLEIDFRLMKG